MDDKEKIEYYERTYGPVIEERGLKNWKNLFRKPSFQDWIILVMLLLMLFSAYAYKNDVAICKEYIKRQNQFDLGNILSQPAPKLDLGQEPFNISIYNKENGEG